jgi:hypothetical protein
MDDHEPTDMTVDDLIGELARSGASMAQPVRILRDRWLATITGATLVDGALVITTGEDVRPATDQELAVAADLVGAP